LLTSLSLHVSGLADQAPEGPLRYGLEKALTVAEEATREASALAHRLRPPALDELGLVEALQQQALEFKRQHPIETDVLIRGVGTRERLPPAVESTLYRIVQEALTNVAKHSEATRVDILIACRPGRVRLIVEDDGRGFELGEDGEPPVGRGLGLSGMRERASLAGGDVRFESSSGVGTTVFVTLPL